jgi:midasin (ATPase involved in ribosome maturation)
LDNLSQGDSCVLERLNPLLENEPIWVLTENRETVPLKKKENFKVFATMTVARNSNKAFYPELSPALYNRFSIIHMENNSWNDEKYFKSEISCIVKCLLDIKQSSKNYANMISNILWLIHEETNLNDKKSEYGIITLRNYTRFIDMFYKLSIKFSDRNIKPELILFKCYKICFEGQFKFRMHDNQASKKSQLYFKIQKILDIKIKDDFYLKDNYKFDETYVLTESRTEFVETVLACIECNIPVLLEGKNLNISET